MKNTTYNNIKIAMVAIFSFLIFSPSFSQTEELMGSYNFLLDETCEEKTTCSTQVGWIPMPFGPSIPYFYEDCVTTTC
ncbi:MAG: hypothetical protein ABJM12_03215 [Ekhidna sp.]